MTNLELLVGPASDNFLDQMLLGYQRFAFTCFSNNFFLAPLSQTSPFLESLHFTATVSTASLNAKWLSSSLKLIEEVVAAKPTTSVHSLLKSLVFS